MNSGSPSRTPGTAGSRPPGAKRTKTHSAISTPLKKARTASAATRTALAWDEDGRFDPHEAVLGVSCERCHGSGIAHVEAQSAGGDPGSIFHPGRLSPADQVVFCGQCHRQPTDFEPREILARDPLLARHAGASLMMSACFRETAPAEAITCTECHDPHRPEPAGPARTRAVCSRCHEDVPSLHPQTVVTADSDCAGCHLPTESEAFHGTPFTDHWIRLPGNAPSPASAAGRRELAWLEELYERRVAEANPPAKTARLRTGLAELLHIRGARAEAQALLREALERGADYETRLKGGRPVPGRRTDFRRPRRLPGGRGRAAPDSARPLRTGRDTASGGRLRERGRAACDRGGTERRFRRDPRRAGHCTPWRRQAGRGDRRVSRCPENRTGAAGGARPPRRDPRRPSETRSARSPRGRSSRRASRGTVRVSGSPLLGSLWGGAGRNGGLHRRNAGHGTRRQPGHERRRRCRCGGICATP